MFHLSKPTYYEIEELLESCTPCTFVYEENIQPMYEFSIFGKMEDFLRKKDVYKVKNKEYFTENKIIFHLVYIIHIDLISL